MSIWNPRFEGGTLYQRKAYNAGYSDSWYDYHYGAGQEDPCRYYKMGWDDAKEDSKSHN